MQTEKKVKRGLKEEIDLDLVDRFDENRMHLEAFIDGIYNTALSGATMEDSANTIMVFCSMATARVKGMEKAFEEITRENGGKV